MILTPILYFTVYLGKTYYCSQKDLCNFFSCVYGVDSADGHWAGAVPGLGYNVLFWEGLHCCLGLVATLSHAPVMEEALGSLHNEGSGACVSQGRGLLVDWKMHLCPDNYLHYPVYSFFFF